METKVMTKTAVGRLINTDSQEASREGGSLMLIIERAATDPQFDVSKLQALLEMKERWSKEEARKAFVVALTNFKANPPEVLKTRHVSFSAGGGKTSYNHADLAGASAQIGAALSAHGLSHRWNVEQTKEGRIAVTCILMHVLGHSESVKMESAADQSGGKNNIQAIGSATSYLQRYTLFAAAGVIAREQGDDDGGATGPTGPVEGPKVKDQEKAPPDNGGPVISEAQAKRFYAIGKGAGKTDQEMKDHLKAMLGIDSTKAILKSDYEAVCEWAAEKTEAHPKEL